MGNIYGSKISYHGNILLKSMGARRDRDRKSDLVEGRRIRGRGRDRKSNFVACSTQIFTGWVVVAWGAEPYSGLAGNTYFVYLVVITSALGMGQTARLAKRNTLCCKSRMEMYFYLVL